MVSLTYSIKHDAKNNRMRNALHMHIPHAHPHNTLNGLALD